MPKGNEVPDSIAGMRIKSLSIDENGQKTKGYNYNKIVKANRRDLIDSPL